jgi:hypothetical protein
MMSRRPSARPRRPWLARRLAAPPALASAAAGVVLAALLAVIAPRLSRAAPGELAAIAVSLTVQESCLVQSTDAVINLANQPVVSCLHDTPFQITQGSYDPQATSSQSTPSATTAAPAMSANLSRASGQPVQYASSREARQTVWMINF